MYVSIVITFLLKFNVLDHVKFHHLVHPSLKQQHNLQQVDYWHQSARFDVSIRLHWEGPEGYDSALFSIRLHWEGYDSALVSGCTGPKS